MMEKTKRKNGNPPIQVFKPDFSYRFGFMLVLIFLIGHFLLMTHAFRQSEDSGMVWLFVIMIPMYGFMFFYMLLARSQKLLIYEDGIEQHYGSRRSFIPWEDLSHFEWRRQGKSSIAGIVTRHTIQDEVPGSFIERLLHSRGHKNFLVLSGIVKVPTRFRKWFRVEIDTGKFRRTEFGKVLAVYAPHLFGEKAK